MTGLGAIRRFAADLALVGAAVTVLAACQPDEVIIPGEREEIRPTVQGTGLERAPDEETNQSQPIRLPGVTRNANWAQSIGIAANRTAHPALSAQPQLIWSTGIGQGDARKARITADPVVASGLVFTLDSSARVSAVTPDGQPVWSTDLVPPSDREDQATGGGMAWDRGVLYVSSGFGRLTALDAATGQIKWAQRLEATGSGTPLVHDGLIYLVAGDDTGWAIRTDTGRVAWRINAAPSVANVLGAPAPVIAGPYVVFAFGSGELIAAFRRGGQTRWNAFVGAQAVGRVAARIGDITGSPVVVGNRIYVGNYSGVTAAVSADSGERVWTARQGATGPVWPAGGSLFMITQDNQLARISAATGQVIWVRDLPGYVKDRPRRRYEVFAHYGPVIAGGQVVVASNDGLLRFYAPEDGRLNASVEVPGGATTAPVVAGGTLYVVSGKGELHAFR